MHILFLSRWYPFPPNNGSKLRIYNLLQGLSKEHDITLLSFIEPTDIVTVDPSTLSFCQEVITVPWKPFNPRSKWARVGFMSTQPRSIVDTFSSEMKVKIDQTLMGRKFDLVIASQIDMASYGQYFQRLPAIFEEAEVGVLHEQFSNAKSLGSRLRHGLTWAKYRRYLTYLIRYYRLCTVVSNKEHQLLSHVIPENTSIEVIPNCVDLGNYRDVQSNPKPNTIIFTGSFTYNPNHEAMVWFLREVYPKILAQVPEVHLYITGDHGGLPLPHQEHVTLTGYVNDIRNLIANSWCSIVPIHTGGGTRLKILEAMALRSPVVSTPKGVEGIDVHKGVHLLIAEDPNMYAEAVVRLLKDDKLRERITDQAYQLIREKYDWEVIMPNFLELVEQIIND